MTTYVFIITSLNSSTFCPDCELKKRWIWESNVFLGIEFNDWRDRNERRVNQVWTLTVPVSGPSINTLTHTDYPAGAEWWCVWVTQVCSMCSQESL